MAIFCARIKSTIRKRLKNNIDEDSIEPRIVQIPLVTTEQACEQRNDDEEGFLSISFPDPSAPIPTSERLFQIGSWPAWKRQHFPRLTGSDSGLRAWVLERLPDPTPFKSIRRTEDILAALDFSYENCISEGPHRSEHSGSVLYCTSLDRMAKFGCCLLCKSIAGTIRYGFPSLEPWSRFEKVVIWCAEWGNLEADEVIEAVVAEAFQDGIVFLTIGEEATQLRIILEQANK